MIYLFHGKNRQEAAEKSYALIRGLLAKKPDASYIKIDSENWQPEILIELSGTQGLFESKHVVFGDNLWSDELAGEKDLEIIADSDNIFVLLENGLTAAELKLLKKYATAETEVVSPKETPKFNVFALADAFGAKEKKNLWVLYTEAQMANVEAEEVHNILFWQLKNLVLAKKNELGKMKVAPFVAGKAKRYAEKWQLSELLAKAKEMTVSYHKARLGITDFDTSLEKMILEL